MKHSKCSRLLALLLALVMVIGMMPTVAFAEEEVTTPVVEEEQTAPTNEDVETQEEETTEEETSTNVAKIGGTEYATLQGAIDAATDGGTVTLLQNVNLGSGNVKFYNDTADNLTFDLGGHTITSSVEGSANSGGVVLVANNVVIKNGTIKNISGGTRKTNAAIGVPNGGTTTLENVTLQSNQSGLYVCQLDKAVSVTVNIEGTTAVNGTRYGVYIAAPKATKAANAPTITLNISGGTISGTENGVYVKDPDSAKHGTIKTNITGGTVSSINVISNNANYPAELTVSGGTVKGVLTCTGASKVAISSGTFNGELKKAGTNGTITISGGTFTTVNPSAYLAEGVVVKEATDAQGNTTYSVVEKGTSTTKVAAIGDTKYESLDAAITAATGDATIQLLADVTVAATVTVPAGKTITLDLNGKTYTSSANSISNAGTLTVKDSVGTGKIVATGSNTNAIENSGTLTIESGSFSAYYGAVKACGGSNTEIKGGTLSDTGKRAGGGYSLYFYANGTNLTVTISGGTFKSNVDKSGIENNKGYLTLTISGGSFSNDLSEYCPTGYSTILDSTTGLYVYGKKAEETAPAGYLEDASGNVTISDEDGLFWFAKQVNEKGNTFAGKTVTLANDITLTKQWTPVGVSVTNSFKGTFDGAGYTISNLNVIGTYNSYGDSFFRTLVGAAVKNVTFANASVTCIFSNIVGIVAGYSYGSSTFENVHVTNSAVQAFGKVGGMVGMAADGGATTTFKNCSVTGTTIHGGYNVAGFCGLVLGECNVTGSYLNNNNVIIDQNAQNFGEVTELDTTIACTNSAASCPGAGTVIKGKYIWNTQFSCYLSAYSDLYNHYGDGKHDCTLATGAILGNSEVTHDAPVAIGDVKYSDLQAAFDAVKTSEKIELLSDITLDTPATCFVSGITLEGNDHTVTCNTATKGTLTTDRRAAIGFGGTKADKTTVYCSGVTVQNLNMTGIASFGLYFHGGKVSTLTNVTISGNYMYAINLYGTHGATLNNCTISNSANLGLDNEGGASIWSNVASDNPLTLNNSKVGIIGINKYTSANKLAPKIFVMNGSVAEIHTYDDGVVSGNKRLCVSTTSTGSYTIKEYDKSKEEWVEVVENYVAQIGDDGEKFATLEEAINAAEANGTVKLLADISLTAGISISKKITLDLNGKTIETNGNSIEVAATGDLTITGSGTINNAVLATGSKANKDADYKIVLYVAAGGKLTIENGTFTTKASQVVYTEGTTTIQGGAFKSIESDAEFNSTGDAIYSTSMICVAGTSATLTMTDGTIYAGGYEAAKDGLYGIYVQDGGNVILGADGTEAGPTIDAYCAAVGENNTTSPANITIYGGTYTTRVTPTEGAKWAPYCATIYASASGKINIHGGTFTGYYIISDRYQKVDQTVTITGGTFNGTKADLYVTEEGGKGDTANRTIAISGGTFTHPVDEDLCAAGFIPTSTTEDGKTTYGVKQGSYVASVTTADGTVTKYGTLADAAKAVVNGKLEGATVTLLTDVDLGTEAVSFYGGPENITLDLGNRVLTSADKSTVNLTTKGLTIQNGTIKNTYSGTPTTSTGALYVTIPSSTTLKNLKVDSTTFGILFRFNKGEGIVTVENDVEITGAVDGIRIYASPDYSKYQTYTGKATLNVNGGKIGGGVTGISVFGPAIQYTKSSATINIKGGLIAGANYGIAGSGLSQYGSTTINITGGTIKSTATDGAGIYHPQDGVLNISSGEIEGATGVEIRAGKLTVTGGKITGTGKTLTVSANGSGSTTVGAGIAVAQHTTGKDVDVSITGGEISGAAALSEANPEKNAAEKIEKVTLSVTGGTFTGEVKSENKTGFISKPESGDGPLFDRQPDDSYCALGYKAEANNAGLYALTERDEEAAYVDSTGATKYGDLATALSSAKANTTITLLKEVTYNESISLVSNNNTIDLNGNNLEAKSIVVMSGAIIDSKEGVGLVKVYNNNLYIPNDRTNGGYLTIYDETSSGFRLFKVAKWYSNLDTSVEGVVKLSLAPEFVNNKTSDAWNLIKSSNASGVKIGIHLVITKTVGGKTQKTEQNVIFDSQYVDQLCGYPDGSLFVKIRNIFTITDGDITSVTATPFIQSATLAEQTGTTHEIPIQKG